MCRWLNSAVVVAIWVLCVLAGNGTPQPLHTSNCTTADHSGCPELHVPDASNLAAFPAPTAAPKQQADPAITVICSMVKNQNSDIREWVYYHHWLGIHRIYLYDHNSARPLRLDLADWIQAGVVVVYDRNSSSHRFQAGDPVPGKYRVSPQRAAYNHCLEHSRAAGHTWAAFIDADEFLVLGNDANTSDINTLLQEYKAAGGVVVNWRIFGSSGHVQYPNRPVLASYTDCIPDSVPSHNQHIKTIAQIKHTLRCGPNPHIFRYQPGYESVTESFKPCDGPLCWPLTTRRLVLHHYVIKSVAEFQKKVLRGGGSGSRQNGGFFHSINKDATAECLQGVRAFRECCGHLPGMGDLVQGGARAGVLNAT